MLINAAVTFGSSLFNVVRKVILPGALPMIFAGLKLAAGTSLLLLVSAEMIAAQNGIGSMVLHYGNLMITTKLMVGVRSEEHTSELQSRGHLVCRLLLEKNKHKSQQY